MSSLLNRRKKKNKIVEPQPLDKHDSDSSSYDEVCKSNTGKSQQIISSKVVAVQEASGVQVSSSIARSIVRYLFCFSENVQSLSWFTSENSLHKKVAIINSFSLKMQNFTKLPCLIWLVTFKLNVIFKYPDKLHNSLNLIISTSGCANLN